MKPMALTLTVFVMVLCASCTNTRRAAKEWPVAEFVDPVTERAPNVIQD